MKYAVSLGGHTITFEDGTFECEDCELSESVPHIFYKDGPESVQKYKYYALGLIQRQPCAEASELEKILDDVDGVAGAGGVSIGNVSTTTGGAPQTTTISGNSVVNIQGDKVHLKDGMPATYEDQQKLAKHIEVARKQDEIRSKMGLNRKF
ncbi:hypothetical protein M199_gp272 [Halogranum tailed virus 1]|uniref:Uncharacterized protein n=1 Tax=Halogranum tailed virus 1 TaxID=1273749 RepID=R4T6T9_9CAUD|nr:hypothetical protein M199_gp272 [Halogranum tailed virus 1]AGM11394.1 hypothetical protein HGTV1_72 [Halogranum tailed virus 1]